MIARVHVTEVFHVRRHRPVAPAAPAEQETVVRKQGGGAEKETLDTRLAVRQPTAHETQITCKSRFWPNAKMRVRIKCVVNRDALSRTECLVSANHWVAPTISEDKVVTRDERLERVLRIILNAIQCRRCIDIPEQNHRVRRLQIENGALKVAGATPSNARTKYGRPYPREFPYAAARTAHALAGAFVPVLLYGLLRALGAGRFTAFTAGAMAELLRVDIEDWQAEVPSIAEHLAGYGDKVPEALHAELRALEERLNRAS